MCCYRRDDENELLKEKKNRSRNTEAERPRSEWIEIHFENLFFIQSKLEKESAARTR